MKYTNKEIEGIENLCRFLCEHQEELHNIIRQASLDIKKSSPEVSNRLIMETPIIQGTGNQIDLIHIGEQKTDLATIRSGVNALLKEAQTK